MDVDLRETMAPPMSYSMKLPEGSESCCYSADDSEVSCKSRSKGVKRRKKGLSDEFSPNGHSKDITLGDIANERKLLESFLFDESNLVTKTAISFILSKWSLLEGKLYEQLLDKEKLKTKINSGMVENVCRPTFAEVASTPRSRSSVLLQPTSKKVKGEVILVKPELETDNRSNDEMRVSLTQALNKVKEHASCANLICKTELNYRKADWTKFRAEIEQKMDSDFHSNMAECDPERAVALFNKTVLDACVTSIPKKRIQQRRVPWWSEHLDKLRKWDSSPHGRVTYAFLPKVDFKRNNAWFNPGRHVVYALTGYGPINSTLFQRGASTSDKCPSCIDAVETLEHMLFDCSLYSNIRYVDLVKNKTDFSKLISSKDSYDKFSYYVNNMFDIRKRFLTNQ
ncbi:hypothetical protein KM043_018826 [Ampulex compressa]|nr:hypothetical protein KM043_018826 [Ampulex compressa]